MNIVVDDTNPSLTYSGQWILLSNGSPQEFDGTVHSTSQSGASVSFQFQGSTCLVFGTLPSGNGTTVLMDVTIDGSVSPLISKTTSSAAVFSVLFYQSSSLEEAALHTVNITNKGGSGRGDFQFDRVELEAPDIVPFIAPSPSPSHSPSPSSPAHASSSLSPQTLPSSTSSALPLKSTNNTATISPSSSSHLLTSSTQSLATSISGSVSTKFVTTSVTASQAAHFPDATSQPSSSSANTVTIGSLIGIVGGVIAFLVFLFLLVLFYRQRKAKYPLASTSGNLMERMAGDRSTVAIPFTLEPSSISSSELLHPSSRVPIYSAMSEKALLQQANDDRLGNNFEGCLTPTIAPFFNSDATPYSTPSTPNGTSNISNAEAWSISPLSETTSVFLPAVPPRPNGSNEARYLSGTTIGNRSLDVYIWNDQGEHAARI